MNARSSVKVAALGLFLLAFLTGAWGGPFGSAHAQTLDPSPAGTPSPGSEPAPEGKPLSTAEPAAPLAPCIDPACTRPAGGWQIWNQLPQPVFGAAVASDGVYIYSAGGAPSDTSAPLSQFVRYDPVNNTWASLPNLPMPVMHAFGVFAEGKVYVFGGSYKNIDGTVLIFDIVQIYDVVSNTWRTGLTLLPIPCQQMGGGYWNGVIYLAGG